HRGSKATISLNAPAWSGPARPARGRKRRRAAPRRGTETTARCGAAPRVPPRPAAASRKCELAESRDLQLPVRRCAPVRNWWCRDRSRSSLRHTLTHVELELPLAAVACGAPELQHSRLRHDGFKGHRHYFGRTFARPEADLHRRKFFQLLAVVLDQVADLVVFARCRSEESELGGLSDDESEFAAWDHLIGAFLHTEGDYRERLERGGEARDRRHRAFDADIVGPRDAASDAYAAAGARDAVIRRTARDRVHQ